MNILLFLFLEDSYVEKELELPLNSLEPIEAESRVSLADTEGDEILASIADEALNDVENNSQLLRGLSEEFMLDDMNGDTLEKSVTVDGLYNQEPSKDDDTHDDKTENVVNGDSVAKGGMVDVLCEQESSKNDDDKAEPSIPIDADEIFNNLYAEEEVATDTGRTTNEAVATIDTGRTMDEDVPTEDTDRSKNAVKIEENRTSNDLTTQQDIQNLDDSDEEEDSIDADDREINR